MQSPQASFLICGIDEAGRGPWAGPVTAAAVILTPDLSIQGLTDSKKLTARQRSVLEAEIKAKALVWSLGWASVQEIDALNILHANDLAMRRAVAGLTRQPDEIRIDGNRVPDGLEPPARAIIKGDLTEPCISAASILAKTARDRFMLECDARYPAYGFARHKGYGTKIHREALAHYGPCPLHRRSFAPVRKALADHCAL